MHSQTAETNQKLYNLSQIRPQSKDKQRYKQLVSLQHSQIELLKTIIQQLNTALQIYRQNSQSLAQILGFSVFHEANNTQDIQKLKIWLKSIQVSIIDCMKKSKEPREIEKIVEVQKIVNVQRVVEVQKPLFIQRIIQIDRPILVQREIQKPVYIERIIEVQRPVFVEKKLQQSCKKCLQVYQ